MWCFLLLHCKYRFEWIQKRDLLLFLDVGKRSSHVGQVVGLLRASLAESGQVEGNMAGCGTPVDNKV